MASCTVNYNLKDAGYANYADQTLTFKLLTAGAEGDGDYVVASSTVTSKSDSDGNGSVTLFRNGDSGIGSQYAVTLPNSERIKFIVPTGTTSIELADLLVNHQPLNGSTPQQSSVYDAAIQRANHTGTQTLSTISDAGTIASQDSDSVSITGGSILASSEVGYNTGGTVTQQTSITTGVTLNQPSGVITLVANTFSSNDNEIFTLTNSFIDANDVVVVSLQDGHDKLSADVTETDSGSCDIAVFNHSNGNTGSVTAKVNFAVIKTATS